MILEPIWEADFSIHSYGFRPNRSTYDAIAYIGNRLTGNGSSYQWIVEGDASYFDTIPQGRLIKAIKEKSSRQGHQRSTLEVPACRCHIPG